MMSLTSLHALQLAGRKGLRMLFLIAAGAAITGNAKAQYRSSIWTAENGLPQNIVRGIAQTPDGYLWIATLDGLARFDGVQFKVFDKSNTQGIVSNRFGSMLGTPDGDLWLNVVESKGLTRYHEGSFRTYDLQVFGLSQDADGHLWILTREGILMWSAALQSFVPARTSLHGDHIRVLHWDDAGFWEVQHGSIVAFVRGETLEYALPSQIVPDDIWAVAIAGDKTAWAETNSGARFHLSHSHPTVLLGGPETSSMVDAEGHIWTYHLGKKLTRFLDVPSSGTSQTVDFRRYYQDREHSLWIGTEGTGLIQVQRQSIQTISRQQGLPDQVVYPIFQDHGGDLWAGIWGVGLSRIQNGLVRTYTPSDGLHDRLVMSIAEDHDHRIWVGTHGGLSILEGERFRQPFEIPLSGVFIVQAIYQDTGGTLWAGTSRGLVAHHEDQTRLYTKADGLATDDIRAIVEAPDKSLWIAGYGGLTHLENGHFTRWTEKEGLPSNNIRSLYLDRDGVLWIGTYDGGIGRMEDGHLTKITMKDGLFNNGAFQILEDAHQNLWMSSNRGVYRVPKGELNLFAAGRLHAVSSVSYGKSDGMLNVECNGGSSPAGTRTADGRLLFPTQEGIAIIDPASMRSNPTPPPVVIESYSIDQVTSELHSPIVVPAGRENLSIQYTALSLVDSPQIRFKYRMEGLDSDWVDAGTRRGAYYSHLPSGKFRFHVIAANSDGVWSTGGVTVEVKVLAPFYRTIWFLMICSTMTLALLAYLWKVRMVSLRRSQQMQQAFAHQLIASQESERQRIAAELHDGIVQRFVAIKNLGHIYQRVPQAERASLLKSVTEQAAAGIDETREISYNLRPVQLDQLGLTRTVAGILRTASEVTSLQIHSTIDNIDDVFPEDLRINFYRIVQESFNNILKHAHATEVHFTIDRAVERIVLTVQDNGSGFPAEGQFSGFGLTGMSERAQLLGGTLSYQTGTWGTILTVHIPLSSGFRNV